MNRKQILSVCVTVMASVLLFGCVAIQPVTPPSLPPAEEPTATAQPDLSASLMEQLCNGTYTLPVVGDDLKTIQLTEGTWAGEPFVPGGASRPMVTLLEKQTPLTTVIYEGETIEAIATTLALDAGGSGTFVYVAVLRADANGELSQIGHALVGDRAEVQQLWFDGAQLHLQALTAGAGDSATNPTYQRELVYALTSDSLQPVD